jgi:hypothetical protein
MRRGPVPRIRTIKPEFFEDEKIGRLQPLTKLIYIGLWIQCCDDYGAFRWSVRSITGALFPHDDSITEADVRDSLEILARLSRISRYTNNGEAYGQVLRWSDHQRVDHPAKKRFPPYSPDCEPSREIHENLATVSRDARDLTFDHGPESGPVPEAETEPLVPAKPTPSVVADAQEPKRSKREQEYQQVLDLWNSHNPGRPVEAAKYFDSKLKARLKDAGVESVLKVVTWWWTSPAADYLRNPKDRKPYKLDTPLGPEKFSKYLDAALDEEQDPKPNGYCAHSRHVPAPVKPKRKVTVLHYRHVELPHNPNGRRTSRHLKEGMTVEQAQALMEEGGHKFLYAEETEI